MMKLESRIVGPWSMNAYALICPDTRKSVLIDPGAEPGVLQHMLAGTEPVAILITHSHPDHIGALQTIRERLGVPVMANAPADDGRDPVKADRRLVHGDELPVGRHVVRVYHTPGHTPDQVCYAPEKGHTILVGDTIFEGGPGKTWSAADFKQTLVTLRDRVLPWPDDAVCYPGHGPGFRLGDKRSAIEAFLKRDHGDFFGDAQWDM